MPVVTVPAGVTSHPHFVPAGSIVKVSPTVGASAVVEYTTSSSVSIANGVAQWSTWPKGAISTETADLANNAVSVRITATAGAVVLDVSTSPSVKDMAAFRGDFGGAPQFVTNPDTGIASGVADSTGRVFALTPQVVKNGLVVMGDSIAMRNFSGTIATSVVDNGDGTATVTGTDLRAYKGDTVSIMGVTTAAILNQMRTKVLSHTLTGTSVTSITYSLGGLYAPNTPSGTTAIVQMERYESDLGFIGHARARTGARFKVLGVFANGGASSDDIFVVLAAALALKPVAIVLQIGTNDVWAKQWSADVSVPKIKKLIDAIFAGGAIPIVNVIPPRINQVTSTSAGRCAPINRWLKNYVRQVGGYVADGWMKTVNGVPFSDVTSAIGMATAAFLDGTDQVHPIRHGGLAQAKALEPILTRIYAPEWGPKYNPLEYAANCKTYFDNVLLGGTSGTITTGTASGGTSGGTVATGLAVTSTSGTTQSVTCSIIQRTEVDDGEAVGNKQRIVITGASAGSVVLCRIAVNPANWAHGDLMEGVVTVKTSSGTSPGTGAPTGMTNPDLLLGVTTTLTGQDNAYACQNQNPGLPINEAETRTLATPQFAFKSQGAATHGTLNYIRHDLQMYFRTSGDATIDISLPMINGPQIA